VVRRFFPQFPQKFAIFSNLPAIAFPGTSIVLPHQSDFLIPNSKDSCPLSCRPTPVSPTLFGQLFCEPENSSVQIHRLQRGANSHYFLFA
jgi:hypothetical protein